MKHKNFLFLPVAFILTLSSCFNNRSDETKKRLYIASYPTVVDYHVSELFSLDGLKVIDIDNGEIITTYTSTIPEGYQFTEADVNPHREVTISKARYQPVSFHISISNMPQLVITSYPRQTYVEGDYFTLDGLVVTCEGREVTDYTCNYSTGNRLMTQGVFDVVISKTGCWSVTYQITVNPAHALSIAHLPNKITYEVGEYFDSTGLVIKDELNNVVTDYTSSLEDGAQFKYEGTTTVTISKELYADASFDLTINPKSGGGTTTYRDLKIYYLNDTHGSFIRNTSENEGGMSYISKYIKTKVSEDPTNALVLSGGDMFQGGYESNETKGAIMIETMNSIGFDAMALGNHEFDWGADQIQVFADTLNCPIISANTFYDYDRVSRPEWLEPYTIITKGDLKIGIIGGAQQNLGSSITGSISDDFYFPSPNSYIKNYSSFLRKNAGCDIIIAIFHDEGFDGYSGSPTKFNDLTQVDSQTGCKYVDAMFFAHDHNRKEGVYNEVPYLEAGCNGKNIGELTLNLKGNGVTYTVEDCSTDISWACTVATSSDPAIEAIAAKEEYAEILAHADDVIFTFKNSYTKAQFALVACMAMYWYVNAHKSEFDGVTIYFSSHNTSGIRSTVDAGIFTRRDLIKVFPFDNQLCIQTCTSRNISNMENSSYYTTYKPTEPVYSDGYTHAVSITYITEYKYAYNYQQSYIKYNPTAKDALLAYLLNNVDPSL